MRSLLDCDGVIGDWLTPALAIVERETGVRYDYHSFDSWHISETFKRDGLDAAHLFNLFEEIDLSDLQPLPGAVEAVAALHALGDVYVVSAAEDFRGRADWLKSHFGMSHKKLVLAHEKHIVQGDLFIDDQPAHVDDWATHHPFGMACLFAQPYNRFSERKRFTWADILDAAKDLTE